MNTSSNKYKSAKFSSQALSFRSWNLECWACCSSQRKVCNKMCVKERAKTGSQFCRWNFLTSHAKPRTLSRKHVMKLCMLLLVVRRDRFIHSFFYRYCYFYWDKKWSALFLHASVCMSILHSNTKQLTEFVCSLFERSWNSYYHEPKSRPFEFARTCSIACYWCLGTR